MGYARESGVELSMALFRNDSVGRSFIEPTPEARTAAVLAKLNPIASLVKDRRVILVDDSIVRGNTCVNLVRMLRNVGARAVHVRVTSPPVIASCHFGVDTPDEKHLFAYGRDESQMCATLGADSLRFLSVDGLAAAVSPMRAFCSACFSGIYPIDVSAHVQRPHAESPGGQRSDRSIRISNGFTANAPGRSQGATRGRSA
jgi:amidophosphoribosyltransferase